MDFHDGLAYYLLVAHCFCIPAIIIKNIPLIVQTVGKYSINWHIIMTAVLILVLFISSITDIRARKIKNVVTFPAIIFLSFCLFLSNMEKAEIVYRFAFVGVLFFAGWKFHEFVNPGDIKLLMVTALACGVMPALEAFCLALIFFILFFMGIELREGRSISGHFKNIPVILSGRKLTEEDSRLYPFAPFLFLAYIVITITGTVL